MTPRILGVLSPKNYAGVFFLRFVTLRKTPTDLNPSDRLQVHNRGRGTLRWPSLNRVAASLFTTQHSEIEEEFIDRGFEDVQGNEIAALGPSQEADKVDQIVKTCCAHSSSADSEDSDPMDFDNKVLETLAHLA